MEQGSPRGPHRCALVTGSTSGIGLGIARALAGAGCDVVLNGRARTDETGHLAAQLAAETGRRIHYLAADVSRPRDVGALVQGASAWLGGLDILVNNAGIQHVDPLERFPEAAWDRVLATNLSAAFHATKAVLPGMRARGWGRIVNVASAHGLVASAFKAAYVAAKHGVVGLTKVTALETAEQNITCNAICPGYVWTPLVEKQLPDQMQAHGLDREQVIREVMLRNQPNRRFAEVAEVGALTVFLCGEGAASITGAAIPLDGGWVAQ